MDKTTFGLMQQGVMKTVVMAVTVYVQLTQEPTDHHLWNMISTVNQPLTTSLQAAPITGSPTTLSGTERTATLEAVAVTILSLRGPCAFYYYQRGGQTTIDHAYVSGLSITYGPQNGRNHIWTYAGTRKALHIIVTVHVQPNWSQLTTICGTGPLL